MVRKVGTIVRLRWRSYKNEQVWVTEKGNMAEVVTHVAADGQFVSE